MFSFWTSDLVEGIARTEWGGEWKLRATQEPSPDDRLVAESIVQLAHLWRTVNMIMAIGMYEILYLSHGEDLWYVQEVEQHVDQDVIWNNIEACFLFLSCRIEQERYG